MGTSTLHLNNPVPSNGAVAASLGGRHTVTATLSGVGAISCKVQAWASADGTDSRMIGAPVVISGTTTVSQTLTFNALDVTQFWLALVEITPACTFSATVENNGDALFSGAVRAPNLRRQLSRGTWEPWPLGQSLASAASATNTSQVMAKAPHKFNRLQVAFGSVSNGAAYNVSGLVMGVTDTLDTFIPSVGETVTEDATTGLVTGISGPLAVASNPSALVSKVWSNWVNMPSIESPDGDYIWLARYVFDGVGAAYGSAEGNISRTDAYGNYWQMKRVTTGANDFCGANSAAFGALANAAGYQTFSHVIEARFGGCEDGQISVGAFGASTIYGGVGGTTAGDIRGGFIAQTNKYCRDNAIGISVTNHARPSINTSDIYNHVVSLGLNSEYDALLMPVFSSNDGFTEALVAKQLMRAFSIREQAAKYGQKVLFVILPHDGASSGDPLAVRIAAEARLFASGGVIDLCPFVQGASRYAWDPTYSDDGIHVNATGWTRLSTYAPPLIAKAVQDVLL